MNDDTTQPPRDAETPARARFICIGHCPGFLIGAPGRVGVRFQDTSAPGSELIDVAFGPEAARAFESGAEFDELPAPIAD